LLAHTNVNEDAVTTTETSSSSLIATQQERVPLYRNTTVIKWVLQVIVLALVIFAGWFFGQQAADNLAQKGVQFDFDFININQGFDIAFGIDANPDTGGRALWVGMVNTIRLALAAIIVSTILGVVLGVSRLSNNWIANRVSSIIIETLRNIPLLVQIFIWVVVFQQFGRLEADTPARLGGLLYTSARGLSIPRLFASDGFYQWLIWIIIGAVVARFVYKNRVAERDATGVDTKAGPIAAGVVLVFALIGWFAHRIWGFLEVPLQAISDGWGAIPQVLVQLLLTALAIGGSALWIKRFLDARRTPAGLAKLTDDDYFRIVFSVLSAVVALVFFWVIWPGLSSWIVNSGSDFWQVAADKFGTDDLGNERTGSPLGFAMPDVIPNERNPNIVQYSTEALTLPIEFMAIFSALTLYTAVFIAEIVRGGILAVPKGQTEAADAIGLNRMQALRFIILPQAFRVSLPPLGNQYLNLTKNTSLAIAALFTDVYVVGNTVINQSGRVLSVFLIWMAFYLTLSLIISVVVNFFNVRLAIVER